MLLRIFAEMIHSNENEISSGQSCPYMEGCDILKTHQDNLPGLVNRFKEHYCLKNHHVCARRWIRDFLGVESVPELMMPQQHDWAEQLLIEAGVKYSDFQERYRMTLSSNGKE